MENSLGLIFHELFTGEWWTGVRGLEDKGEHNRNDNNRQPMNLAHMKRLLAKQLKQGPSLIATATSIEDRNPLAASPANVS